MRRHEPGVGERTSGLSRRRFIAIAAAAGALGSRPGRAKSGAADQFTWRGVALGAQASLTLQHSDEAAVRTAIEACLSEVARLEGIFSLHRADSALVRLNRTGAQDDAPQDLRVLLAQALRLSAATDGAFDPTVQPLWAFYAEHFNGSDPDPRGPSEHDIARVRGAIGWQHVQMEGSRIAFSKPGMALTLNGIAQGYITDRIGDLLRARGFRHVLVNMGEQLAIGPKLDANAWTIGIADPLNPAAAIEELALREGAVATSSGNGFRFDAAGRFTHILDPATGAPARQVASVTVVAPRASEADALSTAFSVLPVTEVPRHLRAGTRAFLIPRDGSGGRWL